MLKQISFKPPSVILVMIAVVIIAGYIPGNLSATEHDAKIVGNETCLGCHDDIGGAFANTVHFLANAEGQDVAVSCESCHGAGSLHVEEGDTKLIFNPAKGEDDTAAKFCVSCHGNVDDDFGFSHVEETGNCSSCHTIHSTNDGLLKHQGTSLCLSCHVEQRAAFALPSHHPVLEGKMECADCHQVHGGGNDFSIANDNRDLCFSCHATKQGPFIFEHDPVNEDCSLCHNPHGTVADNLLVQAEPMLCMSCHPIHFHTQIAGYEGDFTAPMHPERSGTSSLDGFKQAMLTKCTQCHTEVHGSDMPAQSITGPGALIR